MKKIILSLMVALGFAGSAMAENFVTFSGGEVRNSTDGRTTYGIAAGTDVTKNLRGEVAYSYYDNNGTVGRGQTFMANAIPQYQIPGTNLTTYALVGTGYGIDSFGDKWLYNYGVGARFAVTKAVDFDLRAKRTGNLNDIHYNGESTAVTAGVSFKF